MNILDFVIGYADTTQLYNLVVAILKQCDLNGRQISIWADYLDTNPSIYFGGQHVVASKVYTFLKYVSEKKLDEGNFKDLMLHDDGTFITRVFLSNDENLVDTMLSHLSEETRSQIGKCVVDKMSDVVQEKIPDIAYLGWINTVQLMVDYADRDQLTKFVRVISTVYEIDGMYLFSIWRFVISRFSLDNFFDKVDKFLKAVSEKLNEDDVKKLYDGEIMRYASLEGNDRLLEVLQTNYELEARHRALSNSTQTFSTKIRNSQLKFSTFFLRLKRLAYSLSCFICSFCKRTVLFFSLIFFSSFLFLSTLYCL